MIRLSSLRLLNLCCQARGVASCPTVFSRAVESRQDNSSPTHLLENRLLNGADSLNSLAGLQFSRPLSKYVLKFEKKKMQRGIKPKDETAHMPDYMVDAMPNQEDNKEARLISGDVIDKVNNQIIERSHGRLFAVVQLQSRQFKITPEDVIIVAGYWAPTVGDRIRLEKVLLAGGSDFTLLGRPMLPRDLVRIEASVIEKTLSYTKLSFTLIKRKNYRRLRFFKTPYTMLRINSIEFDGLVNERKEIEGERNIIY